MLQLSRNHAVEGSGRRWRGGGSRRGVAVLRRGQDLFCRRSGRGWISGCRLSRRCWDWVAGGENRVRFFTAQRGFKPQTDAPSTVLERGCRECGDFAKGLGEMTQLGIFRGDSSGDLEARWSGTAVKYSDWEKRGERRWRSVVHAGTILTGWTGRTLLPSKKACYPTRPQRARTNGAPLIWRADSLDY